MLPTIIVVKRKKPRLHVVSFIFLFAPISRILYRLRDDDHLSCLIVANQIFAAQTIFLWSTTLHPGKDFAVSFLPFDRTHPEGCLHLSAPTFLLAPLCLRTMGVTHYLAPAFDRGECPDFPLRRAIIRYEQGNCTQILDFVKGA